MEAPSKKIADQEDFIQNVFNSSNDPRNLQGTILVGLMHATFLFPQELDPNHVENAASKGGEELTYQHIQQLAI